eukprot:m.97498 g.97498  ORF g.97498 m.97498 type:complete len:140 (+) comp15225_c0_seq1:325-744(+)
MDGEGLGEERGTPPLTRLSPSLATMISGGRSSPSVLSSLVPVSQDDMLAHVQLEMAGLRDQLAEAVGRADTAEARIRDLERILVQQQVEWSQLLRFICAALQSCCSSGALACTLQSAFNLILALHRSQQCPPSPLSPSQ